MNMLRIDITMNEKALYTTSCNSLLESNDRSDQIMFKKKVKEEKPYNPLTLFTAKFN